MVSFRFSKMSRIRGPGTRGTICWSFCSLRWLRCCAGRRAARTWPISAQPRKTCCGRSCDWSTAFEPPIPSAGCSACSTRTLSRPPSPASWGHSPGATGSRVWWRSTARRSRAPLPRAPRRPPCIWSMSGRPSSVWPWPSAWPPAATRWPVHWKRSSCSRSRAASSPSTPCTAIAPWPRRSSTPRANTSSPSRRTKRDLRHCRAPLRRDRQGRYLRFRSPVQPWAERATHGHGHHRHGLGPDPRLPGIRAVAKVDSLRHIEADRTTSRPDTSCSPGPSQQTNCSGSSEPIGPSRTSSTGCSMSSSPRTAPETARTTGHRISPSAQDRSQPSAIPSRQGFHPTKNQKGRMGRLLPSLRTRPNAIALPLRGDGRDGEAGRGRVGVAPTLFPVRPAIPLGDRRGRCDPHPSGGLR